MHLRPADLNAGAQRFFHPKQLVWIVVGDRAKIEGGLRISAWGRLHLLDADGQVVR